MVVVVVVVVVVRQALRRPLADTEHGMSGLLFLLLLLH